MHTTPASPSALEAFDELFGLAGGLAIMLLPLMVGLPGALLLALVVLVTAPVLLLAALAVGLPIWATAALLGGGAR